MTLEPCRNAPPGHIVRDVMEARGWGVHDLAAAIGLSEQQIDLILRGKKEGRITPKVAGKLADVFGVSRDFWLKLEFNYRQRLGERHGVSDSP